MERRELKALLANLQAGRMSARSAIDRLLMEMGRGGVTLMVDENIYELIAELRVMNYTAYPVDPHVADEGIKRTLRGRILVTNNGSDFCREADIRRFRYGLIWVTRYPDVRLVARWVERALVNHNFRRHLEQVIKVPEVTARARVKRGRRRPTSR